MATMSNEFEIATQKLCMLQWVSKMPQQDWTRINININPDVKFNIMAKNI